MAGVKISPTKAVGAILIAQPTALNESVRYRQLGELLDVAERTLRVTLNVAAEAPAGEDQVAYFMRTSRGRDLSPAQLRDLKIGALSFVREQFEVRRHLDARRTQRIDAMISEMREVA